MDKTIRSVQNPRVKEWAELLSRKGRERSGTFIVEGLHPVQEAIRSGALIRTLIYDGEKGIPAEIAEWSKLHSAEMVSVSGQVLDKISDTVNPQGICAVIGKRSYSIDEVMNAEWSLAVVVDGVQDPGNLGTLIRSADAVNADAVIVGAGSVDIHNPKTVRATMGSIFHLPVVECDLNEWLPRLLQKIPDLQLVSTSLQASVDCYEIDFRNPTWIVVGNEAKGVSPQIERHVQKLIKIPMPGKAESLNVAMAATVLLYEALRQREYS